jgi:thiopeptide-type bacteriocin biosynthesis protein
LLVAERIFHAESDMALAILRALLPGDAGADERWRMTLCGVAALLADLGLGVEERLEVMQRMRASFGREHRADAATGRALGDRLRKERRSLEPLLDLPEHSDHPLAPGFQLVRERTSRLAPLAAALRELEGRGLLTLPIARLAPSYVHMHVNRTLRSAQRRHELVLYDFLARLYESRLARERSNRPR